MHLTYCNLLSELRQLRTNFPPKQKFSSRLTPVVVWGVELYAIRYLLTSFFHFLSSTWAILILFRRDLCCLSTSPFAWGHNGVVFLCSMPQSSKYLSNSLETNWDPLSLIIENGKPWVVKILSKLSIILSDVVEFRNIYWSHQPRSTLSYLKVGVLTNPGPGVAMGHLVRGLIWLALGGLDCLQVHNHSTSCESVLLLYRSQVTILLTATFVSQLTHWGMALLVPPRINLPIAYSSPLTGMYCLHWSAFQLPFLMQWCNSVNSSFLLRILQFPASLLLGEWQ